VFLPSVQKRRHGKVPMPSGMFLSVLQRSFFLFDKFERLDAFDRLCRCDAGFIVVEVDEDVSSVAHAHFIHVGQLSVAVSAFDSFDQVLMVLFAHRIDQINARGVNREIIKQGAERMAMPLDDVINETIIALRPVEKEIGM